MPRGGKRKGAGRKEGSLNKKTIEKQKAEKAFVQRILQSVDRLFNAQLSLAEGSTFLYRVDEVGEGKDKRREHNLVTDPEEIKEVLDETDGAGGTVDETYYYITTKAPDNKAIDSLLDRAFGKPLSKTALTDPEGKSLPFQLIIKQKDAPR